MIVVISQCRRGSVSPSYAAGRPLYDLGVVPGGDMTPEVTSGRLANPSDIEHDGTSRPP